MKGRSQGENFHSLLGKDCVCAEVNTSIFNLFWVLTRLSPVVPDLMVLQGVHIGLAPCQVLRDSFCAWAGKSLAAAETVSYLLVMGLHCLSGG